MPPEGWRGVRSKGEKLSLGKQGRKILFQCWLFRSSLPKTMLDDKRLVYFFLCLASFAWTVTGKQSPCLYLNPSKAQTFSFLLFLIFLHLFSRARENKWVAGWEFGWGTRQTHYSITQFAKYCRNLPSQCSKNASACQPSLKPETSFSRVKSSIEWFSAIF